ncbi:MAG: SH3 domain-containing protein, partial [Duodenibacillus sp.]|nr:SH3 domain-containing protein [Duodenibacillus sp.]
GIQPGMPLMVHGASADRSWLYCESAVETGWIRRRAVAFADGAFRKTWREGRLAASVSEKASLVIEGVEITEARIGTVLPADADGNVLAAVRLLDGKAAARPAGRLGRGFEVMPLAPSPAAVAALGDQLIGQPYGWGDMLGLRDCSSLARDLFAAFALWLPRNSWQQKDCAPWTDLKRLQPRDKEQRMLAEGRPFRTLLWQPGHISLYIGEHRGRPVVLHDLWAVRTVSADGQEGRHVVGRVVVTGLAPGLELPGISLSNTLLQLTQRLVKIDERRPSI